MYIVGNTEYENGALCQACIDDNPIWLTIMSDLIYNEEKNDESLALLKFWWLFYLCLAVLESLNCWGSHFAIEE